MKKNPVLLGLIGAIALMILSFYVSGYLTHKKLDYIIDNPTNQTIEVSVDDQSYTINPKQQISIDLKQGKHTLNHTHTFVVDSVDQGVINPTRALYCIYEQYYGGVNKKDSIRETLQAITLDGKQYIQIDTTSAYFIDDFYYNLHEKLPTFTNDKRDKLLNNKRAKIFRKEDFILFQKNQ